MNPARESIALNRTIFLAGAEKALIQKANVLRLLLRALQKNTFRKTDAAFTEKIFTASMFPITEANIGSMPLPE